MNDSVKEQLYAMGDEVFKFENVRLRHVHLFERNTKFKTEGAKYESTICIPKGDETQVAELNRCLQHAAAMYNLATSKQDFDQFKQFNLKDGDQTDDEHVAGMWMIGTSCPEFPELYTKGGQRISISEKDQHPYFAKPGHYCRMGMRLWYAAQSGYIVREMCYLQFTQEGDTLAGGRPSYESHINVNPAADQAAGTESQPQPQVGGSGGMGQGVGVGGQTQPQPQQNAGVGVGAGQPQQTQQGAGVGVTSDQAGF